MPPSDSVSNASERRPSEGYTEGGGTTKSANSLSRFRSDANAQRIRHKDYVISSLKRNIPRPAQLEYTEPTSRNDPAVFQRSLSALNSAYRGSASSNRLNRNMPLARFLAQSALLPQLHESFKASRSKKVDAQTSGKRRIEWRQPRKRKPRYVNTDAVEYQQPPSPPSEGREAVSIKSTQPMEIPALKGLNSSASAYTIDFGITPLQGGTFFHESTFIGSREFCRSLNVRSRNLDIGAGQAIIQQSNHIFRWGPWNETVSCQLSLVFDAIEHEIDILPRQLGNLVPDANSFQGIHLYRSVITYISDKLSFMDRIDRSSFVERCLTFLARTTDCLQAHKGNVTPNMTQTSAFQLRIDLFNLVFANQIRQIASHDLVHSGKSTDATNAVLGSANRILATVLSEKGLADIRQFLGENKSQEKREAGIRENYLSVEAYLVVNTALYGDDAFEDSRDNLISQVLLNSAPPESFVDVRDVERVWRALFTLLPLDELNHCGILQTEPRLKPCQDRWKVITPLLTRILDLYNTNPRMQASSFNNYCRALFLSHAAEPSAPRAGAGFAAYRFLRYYSTFSPGTCFIILTRRNVMVLQAS